LPRVHPGHYRRFACIRQPLLCYLIEPHSTLTPAAIHLIIPALRNLLFKTPRRTDCHRTSPYAHKGEEEAMNQRFWVVLGTLLLSLAGCTHSTQTRLQAEDDADRDKELAVKTIGDVSSVANADPVAASGVGLVVHLAGKGGGAPPGNYRTVLESDLRKRGFENVKEALSSPDTSLVLVSAMIPAGARKDDPLDLEITVPRESKTSSLRGGQLIECNLHDYESAKTIDPNFKGADRSLQGHAIAKAEGQLLVGFGDGDEDARERQARIWGGGRCRIDRPIYVVLNSDQQFARVAQVIADRINETFHGSFRGTATDLAVAKTKSVVFLSVPPQYRLNLPRYLRVVRLIPMQETQAARIPYRRKLEEQLMDPAHTVTAALRLEALGQDSVTTLKRGLASEHSLVRFCSAEALAYLGSPSCGIELARAVERQPALRAYGLTALASLDEAVCHVELRKLLESGSPETRYGAFRALRALDEREEAIQGEHLNESFWVHRVAPHSHSLVHLATSRRPEIVLFGEDAMLTPPFAVLAGEFTVTANKDDDRCTLSRISLHSAQSKRQCTLKLEDVIRTMALMGGSYPDVVELLRRADRSQCVSCRIAVDALPQAVPVQDLASAGAGDPEYLKAHPEIQSAYEDFGAIPTLFEKAAVKRPPGADGL
jgi:hypothetical protein